VQPSGARKAGLVSGIKQRCLLFFQYTFSMFQAYVLQKLFGAYPGPIGKQALKVMRAKMDFFSYGIQIGLLLKVLLYVANGFGYAVIIKGLLRGHVLLFTGQRCTAATSATTRKLRSFLIKIKVLW
jgi:hypothetical protein